MKNQIFANLQIFFADSKSSAQELCNDVSFVIFGHQTWGLERGGQIAPPAHSSTPAEIGLIRGGWILATFSCVLA